MLQKSPFSPNFHDKKCESLGKNQPFLAWFYNSQPIQMVVQTIIFGCKMIIFDKSNDFNPTFALILDQFAIV